MPVTGKVEIVLGLGAKAFTEGLAQSRRAFGESMAEMTQTATTQALKIAQSLDQIEGFKKLSQQIQEMEGLTQSTSAEVDRLSAAYARSMTLGSDQQATAFQKQLKHDLDAAIRLREELEKKKATLASYSDKLTAAGIDVSKLGEHEERLRRELTAATKEMQAQAQVTKAFSTIGVRSIHDVTVEIQQLQDAYQHLAQSGRVSTDDLSRAHKQLQQRVQTLRGEMSGLDQSMGGIVERAKGLIAAYAGFESLRAASQFVKESIVVFADFDDVMRQAGAASGASGDQLKQLTQLAKQMGEETRFSTSEAAGGLKALALAGLSTSQQMEALPKVLELAAAGSVNLETAAGIATATMSQFGLAASDLAKVNDILVTAFTNSATDVNDLGLALQYVGPVAKAAGNSFQETATVLALLAKNGFSGEKAGTALRMAYASLLNPTKKVQEAIEGLGLQTQDSSGKLLPMTQILRNLRQAGAEAADMFQIFGTEAAPAIMAAASMGRASFESLITAMSQYSGKAAKIAAEMDAGIGGKLRQLQSAWEAVQIAVGEVIDQHNGLRLDDLIQSINRNKGALVQLSLAGVELAATLAKAALAVGQFLVDWKEVAMLMGGAAAAVGAVSAATRIMIALQGAQWFLATGQAATSFATAVGSQGLATAIASAATHLKTLIASSVTAFFFSGATGAGGMALALGTLGLAGAATASVAALGYLGYKLIETHKAEEGMAASAVLLTDAKKRLTERLKEISDQLGINIPNMETFNRLQKEGAIAADEASGQWVVASQAIVDAILSQGAAAQTAAQQIEAMTAQRELAAKRLAALEQQLGDDTIKAQKAVLKEKLSAERESVTATQQKVQQSLAAEKLLRKELVDAQKDIREAHLATANQIVSIMERGMSDRDKDVLHAQQAYLKLQEARKLLMQEKLSDADAQWAIKLAEQSQIAYSNLKTTSVAMTGVRESGQVLEQLYLKQGTAAKKALDEQKKSTVALKDTLEGAKEKVKDLKEQLANLPTKKEVTLAAEVTQARANLDDISRRLAALRDKTITVTTRHVEARSSGGPIGFARGGVLPGWGGGDKISALLEAGEFVLRKEAVQHYGLDRIQAMNHMRIPREMPRFAVGGSVGHITIPMVPKLAEGGPVNARSVDVMRLDLTINGRPKPSVTAARADLQSLVQTLQEATRGL
ncbi:MAG: phage tail tape measure protein [Nitrospirae bacterium]|nr:phage tail tape measure protein [Magnetococcales bacterium]